MDKINKIKKRKRSSNWIEEDKILLKELVKERVAVIENKYTDTNSNQRKKKGWLEIEDSFNSLCYGAKRNVIQLKSQWTFMKIDARKKYSRYKRQIAQASDEPKPAEKDHLADDMNAWLFKEFNIHDIELEPDAIKSESNSSQVLERTSPKKIYDTVEMELASDTVENYVVTEKSLKRKSVKKKRVRNSNSCDQTIESAIGDPPIKTNTKEPEEVTNVVTPILNKETDSFEHLGLAWAAKLRKIHPTQSKIAERLISEVLFQGDVGLLTMETNIRNKRSTSPVQCGCFSRNAAPRSDVHFYNVGQLPQNYPSSTINAPSTCQNSVPVTQRDKISVTPSRDPIAEFIKEEEIMQEIDTNIKEFFTK